MLMLNYMLNTYLVCNFHGIIAAAVVNQYHLVNNIEWDFFIRDFKRLAGIISRQYNHNLFSVNHNFLNSINYVLHRQCIMDSASLLIFVNFKIIEPCGIISIIPQENSEFIAFKSIGYFKVKSHFLPSLAIFFN